jgi:Anticodon binding domain
MPFDTPSEAPAVAALFTAADIVAILHDRGWVEPSRDVNSDADLGKWCARAAELLAPHAADRTALADLLALIFAYDAQALLREPANQAVLARVGARDVIRELANRLLDGGDLDSDRFREIIDAMKAALPHRGRELFYPIRLALAGRAGDGELDRVVLLLDAAASLNLSAPVKGARQRMLEFCAALD